MDNSVPFGHNTPIVSRFIPLSLVAISVLGCASGSSRTDARDASTTDASLEAAADSHADTSADISIDAPADATSDHDPAPLLHNLGRGINLGNALDAPTEGAWGITLEASYFSLIAKAGFDTVRLPVRWSAHAANTPPYAIDSTFMARVDWAVDQALANDLLIVVDVHHYDDLMHDPAAHHDRLQAIWDQIAQHFAGRPPSVGFEVLNEPQGKLDAAAWNDLLADVLPVIRQSNPGRTVVVGPAGWNGLTDLDALKLPESDRNLVVTFHYYQPFHFTHQGASWVDGSDAWLGTTWDGTSKQKSAVDGQLDKASTWAVTHGRKLWMGEFGSYEKADMASRARWTSYVARAAEERGIAWAYWEFGAGFGAYDRDAKAWRKPLLEALIPDGR